MKHLTIKYEKVMGIPLTECFMCGEPKCTRHHVIPIALNPKHNITIPLCEKHKDITHPTIKSFYFPKSVRRKINNAKKHSEDVLSIINSLNKELNFHNKTNATKFRIGKDAEHSSLQDG